MGGYRVRRSNSESLMDGIQWHRGWQLLAQGLGVLRRYPWFIAPILIVWLIYAPGVLYLKYYLHWSRHNTAESAIIVYFFIVAFSFCILLACDVLLELIQQLERDEPSMSSAVAATFRKDLANLLPLAFAWATIWFALSLIEAVLSRRDDADSGDAELDAQGAAEALAGFGSFSLSRAFFEALKKGVRMVVFLILPGIAWEDMNFVNATRKGLAVLRGNKGDFP